MWRTLFLVGGGVAGICALLLGGFTLAFRRGFRPALDVIRRFNRDVTNPRQLRDAGGSGSSTSVVEHVGRSSGRPYRTPVVAVPVDDAYVVALPYGPGADWVRNVLAAGDATLTDGGRTVRVHRPTLVPIEQANPWFPPKEQRLHRLFGVHDFLRLHPVPENGHR